jgi:hypothetical protein
VSKIVEFICATDEGSNNEDDEDSDDSGDEDQEERCAFMRIFVIASFLLVQLPRASENLSHPPPIAKASPRKRRRGAKRNTEYGVARGINFLHVA